MALRLTATQRGSPIHGPRPLGTAPTKQRSSGAIAAASGGGGQPRLARLVQPPRWEYGAQRTRQQVAWTTTRACPRHR